MRRAAATAAVVMTAAAAAGVLAGYAITASTGTSAPGTVICAGTGTGTVSTGTAICAPPGTSAVLPRKHAPAAGPAAPAIVRQCPAIVPRPRAERVAPCAVPRAAPRKAQVNP